MEEKELIDKLYGKLNKEEISYIFWSKMRVLCGGIMLGFLLAMIVLSK